MLHLLPIDPVDLLRNALRLPMRWTALTLPLLEHGQGLNYNNETGIFFYDSTEVSIGGQRALGVYANQPVGEGKSVCD